MTVTARITGKTVVLASIVGLVGALALPNLAGASAGSPQLCTTGTSCTIGEFVYDDAYVPLITATCTLTSRYPDGSLHLNSQAMTAASDGWYAYSFTTPSTLGYYRAQVCCTVGSDYMCLDKAFESSNSSELSTDSIASAVWGYSSRTMTGFGSLVSDIWGHSAREVTNLGVVVRDVWAYATRTLTGNSSTTDSGDLAEIEKTVKENRLLLERLVNKPIVQNFLEEDVPDLGAQVDLSREIASGLYLDTQMVVSKLGVVMLAWEESTGEEIGKSLAEMAETMGKETDTKDAGSVLGQVVWMSETWKWQEAGAAYDQAQAVAKSISLVKRKLEGAGGWKSAYVEAKKALGLAEDLEDLVGESKDDSSKASVYGRLAKVGELALIWDERQAEADRLLKGWKLSAAVDKQGEIEKLGQAILAINSVPNGYTALQANAGTTEVEKRVKNKLLALRALVDANRRYLASGEKKVFANTWLEEGSVVFKSLVTNPSTLITQDVEVKYFLPPEVKEEDVLGMDTGLEVKYDTEKKQYYVQGKYTLKAGESKTVFVRVDDVWVISESEVASLTQQAEQLAKPLEKTSFFAQGVTIKSDIDVALDKIVVLQSTAVTPEQKIRAYREAQFEMGGVHVKMEKLKDLLAAVSSSGSLFGFVGGAQIMAVWGMVIIFTAGFVFLALYMKKISGNDKKDGGKEIGNEEAEEKHERKHHHRRHGTGWKIAITVLVTAMVSAATSGIVVRQVLVGESQKVALEKTEGAVVQEKVEAKVMGDETTAEDEKKGETVEAVGGPDIVRVAVPEDGKVNVRVEPSIKGKIVGKIEEDLETGRLGEEGEWVKIEWEGQEVWVAAEFVEDGQSTDR